MQVENFVSRATEKIRFGNYHGAVEELNQALELHCHDAKVYFLRGLIFSILKEKYQAIADYTQAIHLNPNFSDAYYQRGLVFWQHSEYPKAFHDLSAAIALNPDHAESYFFRGRILSSINENQGAIEDFLKASLLYLKRGSTRDYQDALTYLKAELNRDGFNFEAIGDITFEGGSGDTLESAIKIKGAANGNIGVKAEYQYLNARLGQRGIYWYLEKQKLLKVEHYYDEMHIQFRDGSKRVIFFDITDFFGKGDEDLINNIMRSLRVGEEKSSEWRCQ